MQTVISQYPSLVLVVNYHRLILGFCECSRLTPPYCLRCMV